jgi:hypothetical protein
MKGRILTPEEVAPVLADPRLWRQRDLAASHEALRAEVATLTAALESMTEAHDSVAVLATDEVAENFVLQDKLAVVSAERDEARALVRDVAIARARHEAGVDMIRDVVNSPGAVDRFESAAASALRAAAPLVAALEACTAKAHEWSRAEEVPK